MNTENNLKYKAVYDQRFCTQALQTEYIKSDKN